MAEWGAAAMLGWLVTADPSPLQVPLRPPRYAPGPAKGGKGESERGVERR